MADLSDLSETPRYGLRKRPAVDTQSHRKAKQSRPSLPPREVSSVVARQAAAVPDPSLTDTATNTPTTLEPSTPANSLPPKPLAEDNSNPHQLTIHGRTFLGPLPPNRVTDPSHNADNLSGEHSKYNLFVCEDCPIQQRDEGHNLHDLCYESHPCIWSFPPKAREVYANRRHWLEVGKPLEVTRLPSGRLPRLLDEAGERITRGLVGVQKGADPNKAYEEVVKRRFLAVIKSGECREITNPSDDDHRSERDCAAHRAAREAMLENMSWSFDW